MRLNAKQIAAYTGGSFLVKPLDPSALLTSVTWDSREIEPDCLYVALPGERVDGHQFIEAALRAGARAALVSEKPSQACLVLAQELGASIIEVPHTAHALTDLAREWRHHLKGVVIGLTGSVGKTTTKNLVRDVCAAHGSVVATKANQNNELGVPRTLLAAQPETAVVVVEMGMRGRGQIESLCDFIAPSWGLVTNVGESHIELLGSQENIARAKAELYEALPSGTGVAFVNANDAYASFMAKEAHLTERSVGQVYFAGALTPELRDFFYVSNFEGLAALWAEEVELDEEGRPQFMLCARKGEGSSLIQKVSCRLALTGLHNVNNACAAAAVGYLLGLTLEQIADALAHSIPEPGRQEVVKAHGGYTLINDAYNASPDSMRASLKTFAAARYLGRRIAVLGDMGELGAYAEKCHRGVGEFAAGLPLDYLVCVGDLSHLYAEGAKSAGFGAANIMEAASIADVLEKLEALLEPGDAVLVKASHFMGLQRVVEGLVR